MIYENILNRPFLNSLEILLEDVIGIPKSIDEDHNLFIKILYEKYSIGNTNEDNKNKYIYYNINEMFYISEKFFNKEIYLVLDNKKLKLNIENILNIYNNIGLNVNNDLILNYIVYKYFIEKKYIIKDGFKYGVDYVLYKSDPSIIHSEYCILICNFNEENDINEIIYNNNKYIVNIPKINYKKIISLTRLCESISKRLILTSYDFKKQMIYNLEINRFN